MFTATGCLGGKSYTNESLISLSSTVTPDHISRKLRVIEATSNNSLDVMLKHICSIDINDA